MYFKLLVVHKMNLLFFCLLASVTPSAPLVEELSQLHSLLEISRENVKVQEELYQQVTDYYQLREAFLNDSENRKLATKLAKAAKQVKEKMEKEHLDHLFSTLFLEEVKNFAALIK